jgi:hypothetical protein
VHAEGVQTKLAVNEPGDTFEREADRVADHIMRHAAVAEAAGRPAQGGMGNQMVQRRCAECEDEVVHRQVVSSDAFGKDGTPEPVEPLVARARAGGESLPPSARAFFEGQFGHDFTRVRVHTGAAASASAAALNARAYTVGHDVVFAAGEYQPHTSEGRHLLAHELTHVVQQGAAGGAESGRVQRSFVSCGSRKDCRPRDADEVARSRSDPFLVGDVGGPVSGLLVANFGVNDSGLKARIASDPLFTGHIEMMKARDDLRWEVLGFSDCHGTPAQNTRLRKERSAFIALLLGPALGRVVRIDAAPLAECIASNTTGEGRAYNRSAFIKLASTAVSFRQEELTGTPFVCGPDVTNAVDAAIASIYSGFASLTNEEQEENCEDLYEYPEAKYSWDILQLYNKANDWIHENYRKAGCASAGAKPVCGDTVQVGDACFYSGSANYVIFGHMCRICFDKYVSERTTRGRRVGDAYPWRKAGMVNLIDMYKGSGFAGITGSPSGNFRASTDWAIAGWDRWRAGDKAPKGDRNHCKPACPKPYADKSFEVRWCPFIDTYGDCRTGREQPAGNYLPNK